MAQKCTLEFTGSENRIAMFSLTLWGKPGVTGCTYRQGTESVRSERQRKTVKGASFVGPTVRQTVKRVFYVRMKGTKADIAYIRKLAKREGLRELT